MLSGDVWIRSEIKTQTLTTVRTTAECRWKRFNSFWAKKKKTKRNRKPKKINSHDGSGTSDTTGATARGVGGGSLRHRIETTRTSVARIIHAIKTRSRPHGWRVFRTLSRAPQKQSIVAASYGVDESSHGGPPPPPPPGRTSPRFCIVMQMRTIERNYPFGTYDGRKKKKRRRGRR